MWTCQVDCLGLYSHFPAAHKLCTLFRIITLLNISLGERNIRKDQHQLILYGNKRNPYHKTTSVSTTHLREVTINCIILFIKNIYFANIFSLVHIWGNICSNIMADLLILHKIKTSPWISKTVLTAYLLKIGFFCAPNLNRSVSLYWVCIWLLYTFVNQIHDWQAGFLHLCLFINK